MSRRTLRRVVLLYHDPLLRQIVEGVFSQDSKIRIVGEFPASEVPTQALVDARPDVVIVDRREHEEHLPATVGDLLATLTQHYPSVRLIVMSLAESSVFVFSGWQLPELPVNELLAYVHDEPVTLQGTARRGKARRLAS